MTTKLEYDYSWKEYVDILIDEILNWKNIIGIKNEIPDFITTHIKRVTKILDNNLLIETIYWKRHNISKLESNKKNDTILENLDSLEKELRKNWIRITSILQEKK